MKLPAVLKLDLFKEAASRWVDDKCYRMGASLAYYALFSIFPLALLSVTAIGFVLGDGPAARQHIVAMLGNTAPDTKALLDQTLTAMQQHETARGVGAIVGFVTLLFGASGAFAELETALNTIWRCPEPKTDGILATIKENAKEKALSFAVVLACGVLLFASLVASTALAALSTTASAVVPFHWAWQLVEIAVSMAFLTAMFATMFRVLPTCRVAWRDVLGGAFLTTLLFTALKGLLAYYLGHIGSYAAYGAVGAVLGLLTWIYLVSLLVFFGAEVTRVYAERHGSLCANANANAKARAGANASANEPPSATEDAKHHVRDRKPEPRERPSAHSFPHRPVRS